MWEQFITGVSQGDFKALARSISLVENAVSGYESFLGRLPSAKTAITGITGPPGAGKSTLVDALIGAWVAQGKKVGVLCVDPSSPFNLGALLGDRIRMSEWYQHPHVFIRSLASRGALGGLHPQMIEITALMQAAGFDELIVETVGVGQSEIEVAGLADTTVVVVVPEAGDEVQTMKAGVMEIADVFVVNKSDRPDADLFVKNLKQMLAPAFQQKEWEVPVIKTIASRKEGVDILMEAIAAHQHTVRLLERKSWLFTERAYRLIQKHRMASIDKEEMKRSVTRALKEPGFNLFTFVQQYL